MKTPNIENFMKAINVFSRPLLLVFFICVVVLFVCINPFHPYSVKVSIDSNDSETGYVKVYYKNEKHGYSEKKMSYDIPDRWIEIPAFEKGFRFDPTTKEGLFSINTIVLRKKSILKIEYISINGCNLGKFFNLNDINFIDEENCIWESISNDPFFYDFEIPANFKGFAEERNLVYRVQGNGSLYLFVLFISLTLYLIIALLRKFFLREANSNFYIISLIFFMFFGVIFALYTPRGLPPDELAHLSYIDYMTKSDNLYPVRENMHLGNNDRSYNYLAHPPMYYFFVSNLSEWNENDFERVSNIAIKRLINTVLYSISLSLVFALALNFEWEKETHLLFVAILFTIPCFMIFCNTVNNDNLSILSGALSIFSVFLHQKYKKDIYFYLIIISVSLALFSKITTAILVGAFVLLYLIYIKKEVLQRKFLDRSLKNPLCSFALFILFFSLSFYVYYKTKYGTFIPSVSTIDVEAYKASGFFIPEENRTLLSLTAYIKYFYGEFWASLWGVRAHSSLNTTFVEYYNIGYFLLIGAISAFVTPKNYKEKNHIILIIGLLSIIFFGLIHFYCVYTSYKKTGYTGGFSARYYFPFIFIFIFASCFQINTILCLLKNNYVRLYQIAKIAVIGTSFYAFYLYFNVIRFYIKACL